MSFDSHAILTESGEKEDGDINLFNVAMAFAAPAHEGISIDKYFNHVTKAAREVEARYEELVAAGAKDDVRTKLAALKHINNIGESAKLGFPSSSNRPFGFTPRDPNTQPDTGTDAA